MNPKGTKIYIAGKYHARVRLRAIKKQLEQMGYEVLSHWIDTNPLDDSFDGNYDALSLPENIDRSIEIAERDVDDVLNAHIYILDTLDESATGGREVECGIAVLDQRLGRGKLQKELYRVGPVRNVFHVLLPGYTWQDLLVHLGDCV